MSNDIDAGKTLMGCGCLIMIVGVAGLFLVALVISIISVIASLF